MSSGEALVWFLVLVFVYAVVASIAGTDAVIILGASYATLTFLENRANGKV